MALKAPRPRRRRRCGRRRRRGSSRLGRSRRECRRRTGAARCAPSAGVKLQALLVGHNNPHSAASQHTHSGAAARTVLTLWISWCVGGALSLTLFFRAVCLGACLADFLACLPCLLAFLPCLPTLAFPLSVILSLTQVTSLATHPTGIPRPAAATGSEDGGIKVWTLGPMEDASDGLAGGGFGGLGGDDDEGGAGNTPPITAGPSSRRATRARPRAAQRQRRRRARVARAARSRCRGVAARASSTARGPSTHSPSVRTVRDCQDHLTLLRTR